MFQDRFYDLYFQFANSIYIQNISAIKIYPRIHEILGNFVIDNFLKKFFQSWSNFEKTTKIIKTGKY